MGDQILERRTLAIGEFAFRQGDAGDRAYVVQSGNIEIVRSGEGGDVVLGAIGKGGIFGEMALIDSKPRMAGARATEPTTLIVVSRDMLNQKLAKTDPFVRGLLNIFAETIRSMSAKAR